jgi:hypothetical protein
MQVTRLFLVFVVASTWVSAAEPDARLSGPYAPNPDHIWNRLHRDLFVRTAPDGSQRTHALDPLLYRGGTFLLEGEPHRRAVATLDQFLAAPLEAPVDTAARRVMLQRDLWAVFDYVAWYPDEWVHHARHEPAARALRTRLAKGIGRLALEPRDLDALPDNYAMAVKLGGFATAHDPGQPQRPFLPPGLFDPTGPWVRFHETTAEPMTIRHFEGAGGRAAHVVFLRLPGGRAATDQYLREPNRTAVPQFPPGTMVAMVRRALAVDRSGKVHATPITESVQVRVYRRIPADSHANMQGDFGEQDVCEFVLDRAKLFAGGHGLRPVAPGEITEPFTRDEGDPFAIRGPAPHPDPFTDHGSLTPALKNCIQCHQAPGIHSVLTTNRALAKIPLPYGELFRTYDWEVELGYTIRAKIRQYCWGLLQGLLESQTP